MKSAMCVGLALAATVLSHAVAEERELASDGSDVRLTISDRFTCAPEAEIKIITASAAYFDQGAETVQRLVNTASAVLGFECPKISHLTFTGLTDGVVVFEAAAKKQDKWALQTAPAPLEALALFFSLYEPDFSHLGTAQTKLNPYRTVTGIQESYQYQALDEQIKRLASVADGDIEKFRTYLQEQGGEFRSFESALSHYQDVLSTIKDYAPTQYPAYSAIFAEESNSLKDHYWSSRVTVLFESEKPLKGIVSDAETMANAAPSSEFKQYIDSQLASWIGEEAEFIREDINDAPLFEVSWAAEYLSEELPQSRDVKTLPQTAALIASLETELPPRIAQRTEALQSLAVEVIKESGSSYADVDTILETGFALAGEFEESGFVDAGHSLLAAMVSHIEHVLASGLDQYKQELASTELTDENASALQAQAEAFQELSTQFNGFAAYQKAAENRLREYEKGSLEELASASPSGEPDAQGIRACDRLAADPYDTQRLAAGIDIEKADIESFDIDEALDACIAAVEHDPADVRQQFQLGRLLWFMGDQESARDFIERSASSGYAAATYLRAEMLLATSDDQNVFIDALDMFKASGQAGYAKGLAMVKELNPDGIDFYKEIPPPTPQDIVQALPGRDVSYGMLGVTTSVRVVDAKIKECFQTSATDFSCEYMVVAECGTTGNNSQDEMVQFMNMVMKFGCDYSMEYTFGTFRRGDGGRWQEIDSGA
ncbi:hypothetical protein [Pseudomonas fluorescens]|uniref:Sel1 repeat family protein n=1 Tax=Pseudomonas fluorescens TaxID=294 RepID=A0A944DJK7_PSEFL|nr:hypothetical protein [Pseudomonas fluorescens]MBT2311831.1 hypothetical protein [Pseudomonas fluorescens]MBT2316782.1 hypothetical protein [Pseudomonas fluorescens]MBT2329789.1 hypothetical protein [Pseudomonas fluorescens]MBT2344601.1 hypothetical protein [Pseudomonas fluorescens]MBT2348009.1 hypothetical protein [Pseudomonas fluorescens]